MVRNSSNFVWLICTVLFVLAAYILWHSPVKTLYYGSDSAHYILYSLCKTVTGVLYGVATISVGRAFIRFVARDSDAKISLPGVLVEFIAGFSVLQALLYVLGSLGLVYRPLLLGIMAIAMFSGRNLMSGYISSAICFAMEAFRGERGVVQAGRLFVSRRFSDGTELLGLFFLRVLVSAQFVYAYVVFGLVPNDSANDNLSYVWPYVEDIALTHSILGSRFFIQFFHAKGDVYNILFSVMTEPYGWQVSSFMLFLAASAVFYCIVLDAVKESKVVALSSLYIFAYGAVHLANQVSTHAARTCGIVFLVYLLFVRVIGNGLVSGKAVSATRLVLVVALMILDPKFLSIIGPVLFAVGVVLLFSGREKVTSILLVCTVAIVVSFLCLLQNYMVAGFVDWLQPSLFSIQDRSTFVRWISPVTVFIQRSEYDLSSFFTGPPIDIHAVLAALRYAYIPSMFGGKVDAVWANWSLYLAVAALFCGMFRRVRAVSAMGIFASLNIILLIVSLYYMFYGHAGGIDRYTSFKNVIAFLVLVMSLYILSCSLIGRFGGGAFACAMFIFTIFLAFGGGDPARSVLYAFRHKNLDFIYKGNFVNVHKSNSMDPSFAYSALKNIPNGEHALILNWSPGAAGVPGGVFQADLMNSCNNKLHYMFTLPPSDALKWLQSCGFSYLLLDLGPEKNKLNGTFSPLIYSPMFSPDVVHALYTVAYIENDKYLLKARDVDDTSSVDMDFAYSYLLFYNRLDMDPYKQKLLHDVNVAVKTYLLD